jgi:hypothetical protein
MNPGHLSGRLYRHPDRTKLLHKNLSTFVQRPEERFALSLQAFFQSFGTLTVATSPRFGAIFMPAVFAIMGVPDTQQFKKLLPIRPFFGEGRGAKTGHWHPIGAEFERFPSFFSRISRGLGQSTLRIFRLFSSADGLSLYMTLAVP